jgi:hypothetical protein
VHVYAMLVVHVYVMAVVHLYVMVGVHLYNLYRPMLMRSRPILTL